jgi:hypothetical protein
MVVCNLLISWGGVKLGQETGDREQKTEEVTGGFAAVEKLAVRVVLRPFPAQNDA